MSCARTTESELNMNELKVLELGTLKNSKLNAAVNSINTAIATIGRNTWKVADTFGKIITEELFFEDFGTQANFAEAVGFSKGAISRLVRSSELHKNISDLENWSVSLVQELLPLEDTDLQTLLETLNGEIPTRDYIRNYIKGLKPSEEENNAEPSEEENNAEPSEEENNAEPSEEELAAVVVDTNTKLIAVDGVLFKLDDGAIEKLMNIVIGLEKVE